MEIYMRQELAKLREASVIDTLEERRIQRGMSFRDLAKTCGVSHSTINDIFRRKQIKLWHMFLFADCLGMTMSELTYLSNDKFSEEYDNLHAQNADATAV